MSHPQMEIKIMTKVYENVLNCKNSDEFRKWLELNHLTQKLVKIQIPQIFERDFYILKLQKMKK